MEILMILIVIIGTYFLIGVYAKGRTERQERERAGIYPATTEEDIKRALELFFFTKDSKDVTDYLKKDIKNLIFAKTYIIKNNSNAANTFLAVKDNLKHELNDSYIFPNTVRVERNTDAMCISERMYFYNNDNCHLILTNISNDRYDKGHHRIIIALEKDY